MKITIKHTFTTLNTYTNSNRHSRFAGAKIKKEETEISRLHFINQKPITEYPIKIAFKWYVKNKRKDLDNIVFAKKFILDGMVKAEFIKNDGLNYIQGFTDEVEFDKDERVEIEIL